MQIKIKNLLTYSILTTMRLEKGNKYLYPATIRGKKRCTVSQTTFIKFHKAVAIINSFTKILMEFPTVDFGRGRGGGGFTRKLDVYIPFPPPSPTLNFNSSPQQKRSNKFWKHVVESDIFMIVKQTLETLISGETK